MRRFRFIWAMATGCSDPDLVQVTVQAVGQRTLTSVEA